MDSPAPSRLTLVDSHVHFYPCFDTERFLSSALENFAAQASRRSAPGAPGALLLAEGAGERWFEEMAGRTGPLPGGMSLSPTDEAESLAVRGRAGGLAHLVAGSQVVTGEGLEVLALGVAERFPDGLPVDNLLDAVRRAGGLPVLPWGAGKWWGERGRIVNRLLQGGEGERILCSDSGVRPYFWPCPAPIRQAQEAGAAVLGGSDPLPLPSEETRAGSFGSALPLLLSERSPAADLKRYLLDPEAEAVPYGEPAGLVSFFANQLRLRLAPGGTERRGG